MVDYFRKAAHGTLFLLFFSFFGSLVGYLLRFLLTAELTPLEYGLFYSCLSVIGLFTIFKEFGLNQSLVYHLSRFKAKKRLSDLKGTILIVSLLQLAPSILVFLLIFFFSDWLAINYLQLSSDVYKGVLMLKILAVVSILQNLFGIFHLSLQGFQKIKWFSSIEFVRLCSWFLITYLFILFGFGYLAPGLGFLASYLIVILISSKVVFSLIPPVKANLSKKLINKIILYGLPVMFSSVAGLIVGYTDTILITLFRGLEEVSIYQTAQPTARLLWFIPTSIATVLFPLVAELNTRKSQKLSKGISFIYKYLWVSIVPLAFMAFSFSSEILNLFFGSFYTQGSEVLMILSLGAIFFSLSQINGTILNGLGKPKEFTKLVYIGSSLNFIGNLALIPSLGVVGAAISTFFTYVLMCFLSFFKVKKSVSISLPVAKWIKTLIAGLISLSAVYLLKAILYLNILVEVLVCFSVSMLIYLILLIFLKVVDVKEVLRLTKQILKK